MFTKRIAKELQQFCKNENNIYLVAENDQLSDLRALLIGPDDTPFEGAFFYFSINPESYPHCPPKVTFLTPYSDKCRMHPNLYAEGKVCLSILGTWGKFEWSPLLTFEKILLTIQGLLDNHPLSHEPSFEMMQQNDIKSVEYAIQSRWLALNSVLFMHKRQDIPEMFRDVISSYVQSHKEQYQQSISKLEPYDNKTIHTIHGNHKINVMSLRTSFDSL